MYVDVSLMSACYECDAIKAVFLFDANSIQSVELELWPTYEKEQGAGIDALPASITKFVKNGKAKYLQAMEQAYVEAWESSSWVAAYPSFT